MSIVLGHNAPVLGMGNQYPLIVREAIAAISAAGGEVLSFPCLQNTLLAFQDNGEDLLALDIKAKSEAAGGTILDMTCLYNLAKAIN